VAYITEGELRAYAGGFTTNQRMMTKAAAATRTAATVTTVFLSHSHQDAELVESAVLFLASRGVAVYVDWKDPTMPRVTSPETAARIKERIGSCKKFVLLGTNNAVNSRWIPWELGVADTRTGMSDIAIMPVVPQFRQWDGHEYVGIYSRMETADDGRWAVFPAGQNRGMYLENWLKK
jgi:hypothetical protein